MTTFFISKVLTLKEKGQVINLSGESFKEKYKNRKWIALLENPKVDSFVSTYLNFFSKVNILNALNLFFRESKNDNIGIKEFLDFTQVQARNKIWEITQRYIQKDKSRQGHLIKIYSTAFYQHAHEEEGLKLNWGRKYRVPSTKVREGIAPTHTQIYRLADIATHIDVKTMILLSYSSGLKGAGLNNLRVKHLREALEFRGRLVEEFTETLNKTQDPEKRKELSYILENMPIILRIDPSIYGKRFTDNSKSWYPAFVCKDAETLLMKYYSEYKLNSDDEDFLFSTRTNKKLDQVQLSTKIKYALKKYYKTTKELKNTSPSLIRRSFFSRLIAGNMKDIFREYIMGHSLEVKAHYFSWDLMKKDIILQYLNCNFNKLNGNYGEQLSTLREDSLKEIAKLKKELAYFNSQEFTSEIVAKVLESKNNPFNVIDKEPTKTIEIKIPLDSGKELDKLLKDGYEIKSRGNEFFILKKEVE